jgi:hypothetical protein
MLMIVPMEAPGMIYDVVLFGFFNIEVFLLNNCPPCLRDHP